MPVVGQLIRATIAALEADSMEAHGSLWIVAKCDVERTVDARSLLTGEKWVWFKFQYEEAPECSPEP